MGTDMARVLARSDWDALLGGRTHEAPSALEDILNSASASERLEVLRRASGSHLAALFDACREPARGEELIPSQGAPLREVVFDGINSLPLFRRFQKRFTRTEEGICGYNHTPFTWATTPGYFVVQETGGPSGSLVFDYTRTPKGMLPAGWPRVLRNEQRLGRFVYAGLVDEVRRVSRDVVVGAVARNGRPIGTYFLLVRHP